MATTIRLRRVGRKKQAHFRIVVTDRRTGPRGPAIERLGIYNPRTQPSLIKLDAARALYWLREGAEPSHSVRSLLRKTGVWEKWSDGVVPEELAPEEVTVLQSPAGGRPTTSQRPKPDIAAEKKAAEKAKAAAAAAAAAEAKAEAEAEAEAEAATEAEEVTPDEEAPEAQAEEGIEPQAEAAAEPVEAEAEEDEEAEADEAEAPEASAEAEVDEKPEPEADEDEEADEEEKEA